MESDGTIGLLQVTDGDTGDEQRWPRPECIGGADVSGVVGYVHDGSDASVRRLDLDRSFGRGSVRPEQHQRFPDSDREHHSCEPDADANANTATDPNTDPGANVDSDPNAKSNAFTNGVTDADASSNPHPYTNPNACRRCARRRPGRNVEGEETQLGGDREGHGSRRRRRTLRQRDDQRPLEQQSGGRGEL